MKIITGKAEIQTILDELISIYNSKSYQIFLRSLHNKILKRKVKFPVLEYACKVLMQFIPAEKQISFLSDVVQLDEIGSYVIAGKILQSRLSRNFKGSIEKACEYIAEGDKWYACDIISERVMGHSLLTEPEKTIPVLIKLAQDENKWLVRSVGVAAHYAVKKGLNKNYCEKVFKLLLSHADTTDFHTKKGIGWGAKTVARFHPDIIDKYKEKIYKKEVKQWFKTKVKTGLSYAKRNSGKNDPK